MFAYLGKDRVFPLFDEEDDEPGHRAQEGYTCYAIGGDGEGFGRTVRLVWEGLGGCGTVPDLAGIDGGAVGEHEDQVAVGVDLGTVDTSQGLAVLAVGARVALIAFVTLRAGGSGGTHSARGTGCASRSGGSRRSGGASWAGGTRGTCRTGVALIALDTLDALGTLDTLAALVTLIAFIALVAFTPFSPFSPMARTLREVQVAPSS